MKRAEVSVSWGVAFFSKVHNIVALLALIFGILFAFIAPPLWGLDEIAHFNRVYEIAQGQLKVEKQSDGSVGNPIPSNLAELEYGVYADLMDNKPLRITERKDVTDKKLYTSLGKSKFDDKTTKTPITSSYSPAPYLGPIVGTVIANVFDFNIHNTILFARLGGLVTYVAALFYAIKLLSRSRIKWIVVIIGLLPVAIMQAATISADTLANGLGLVLFACMYRASIIDKKLPSRRQIIAIIVIAMLLPLIKINMLPVSLLALLLPFGSAGFAIWKIRAFRIGLALLIVCAAILSFSLTPVVAADDQSSQRLDGQEIHASSQLTSMIKEPRYFIKALATSAVDHSDEYISSITTTIGWNNATSPRFMTYVLFLFSGIILLSLRKETQGSKRIIILMALASLGGIISVFAALYINFNPVNYDIIDGVQGRYFIPYLAFGSLLFTLSGLQIQILNERMLGKATIILSCSTLLLSLACYIIIL